MLWPPPTRPLSDSWGHAGALRDVAGVVHVVRDRSTPVPVTAPAWPLCWATGSAAVLTFSRPPGPATVLPRCEDPTVRAAAIRRRPQGEPHERPRGLAQPQAKQSRRPLSGQSETVGAGGSRTAVTGRDLLQSRGSHFRSHLDWATRSPASGLRQASLRRARWSRFARTEGKAERVAPRHQRGKPRTRSWR